MNDKKLLDDVVVIARRAGDAILEIYGTEFQVEIKEDKSPLTDADLASHRVIMEGLANLDVALPVLSEESAGEIDFAQRADWNPYWLVDPLDGTKEFIKRNGEFTVNIALIRDHEPVLGVVHVPVSGVTYFGARDIGAFRRRGSETPQAIKVASGERAPVIVGSRSHRGSSLDAYLARVGEHEMVAMGSSLKFCVVAEGGADVYPRLGPTSEWDTAAAHAVVVAAGGRVIGVDGEPLRYNAKENILNPHFLVIGNPARNWLGYLD